MTPSPVLARRHFFISSAITMAKAFRASHEKTFRLLFEGRDVGGLDTDTVTERGRGALGEGETYTRNPGSDLEGALYPGSGSPTIPPVERFFPSTIPIIPSPRQSHPH